MHAKDPITVFKKNKKIQEYKLKSLNHLSSEWIHLVSDMYSMRCLINKTKIKALEHKKRKICKYGK